jgi:site-specific DNA-methyltransferase (adenine-specific)
MHGKFRKDETTAYLSIDMPNTFSMSPEYVRGFVKRHHLKQLPADVFKKLGERVPWLLREGSLPARAPATVIEGDATRLPELLSKEGVRSVGAIVTSPPYLGVLRYGAFNWIRLWFLGHDPFTIDRMLDGTDSLDRYLGFMASFLTAAAEVLPVGAPAALVIGDVDENGQSVPLAKRVWAELSGVVPFDMETIATDRFNTTTKTTRIWGEDKRGRATPLDRVLVLRRRARATRRRSLPPMRRAAGQ